MIWPDFYGILGGRTKDSWRTLALWNTLDA
jgi:hypothetical protein